MKQTFGCLVKKGLAEVVGAFHHFAHLTGGTVATTRARHGGDVISGLEGGNGAAHGQNLGAELMSADHQSHPDLHGGI